MARSKNYIGNLLVESGLLSEEQLENSLRIQREERPGERIGTIFTRLGYVTSEDLAKTLARQMQLPYMGPDFEGLDPQMSELMDREAAERLRAVPVCQQDDGLLVAMVHPDDMVAMDDLSVHTGEIVHPGVVSPMTLEFFLNQIYRENDDSSRDDSSDPDSPAEEVLLDSLVVSLDGHEEDSQVVQLVNSLLHQAIEERASDLHIQPEVDRVRVRYRIDGLLHDTMTFEKEQLPGVVSRFKILAQMDISERRIPQDGRIRVDMGNGAVDLRISSFPTLHGEKIVVRILDQRRAITSIDVLGMLPEDMSRFRPMLEKPWGMILVSGPTGSGKSTTLNAGLHQINNPEANIMTLEDPVEYRIPGANQSQIRPKAGFSFASGLRSIVRQDPDVIMIGEIRDTETAEMAVRSALTGHLVLSTVHTNNAAGTVGRLVDMQVEPYLIGSTLLGVVGQRLVRTLCNSCSEEYQLARGDRERFSLPLPDGPVTLRRPVGCPYCNETGYRGRIGIYEVMEISKKIIKMIADRKSANEIQQQAVREGMSKLVDDGVKKVLSGITSLSEVRRVAYDISE